MNATYTITFKGFSDKSAAALEAMLRADIAAYPERMSMTSAQVAETKKPKGKNIGKS